VRHRLLRAATYLSYTPLLGLAASLSLIRITIYSRLLSVGDFGLLSKLLLISSLFGTAGSLGFQLIAQRDLPALFAEGRYRNGLIALSKAITVTTISAFLVSAFSLLNIPILGVSGFLLFCSIVHGWSQQVFMLAVIDTRSRLEMMRYAKQVLVKTLTASVVAAAVAALGGGPVGIVFAELLVTLLLSVRLIAAITKNIAKRILWKISIRSFRKNDFSTALTLFLSTLLMFFSTNIDRWLAADRLQHDDFGLYAFAWISLTAALSFQALLNAGIFPLISRRRKEGHAKAAFRTTASISLAMLFAGIVIACMVYLFAQWFLPNKYQRYAAALPLIMPLLLAAVLRLADFWSSYLIVMHRQNLLMKIQIFLILIPCFYYFALGSSSVFSPIDFAWLAVALAAGNFVLNGVAAISNKKEA
jgi:O-antigen/teichoic acid export membrane protein